MRVDDHEDLDLFDACVEQTLAMLAQVDPAVLGAPVPPDRDGYAWHPRTYTAAVAGLAHATLAQASATAAAGRRRTRGGSCWWRRLAAAVGLSLAMAAVVTLYGLLGVFALGLWP